MSTEIAEQQVTDRAAIAAVLAELVNCWNRADGTGYGQLFTADADYIDVTGTHTQGGEAIGRLHQFLFDGPLKGSRLDGYQNAPEVAFLAPDVALIISGGNSRLAAQAAAPPERASINTTILVRQDDTWRIRAFQNNRVTPMAGGPPPGAR
jgi:uncharacterized protein (TIGR02246 family)